MISLVGIGYDIHRFTLEDRPLVLGGIKVPAEMGLDGHSDADVLCHAIADAILGAAGLEDIGFWFPPGDPSCKNICSLNIVSKAASLVKEKGGRIINIDATVIAEAPKIAPYLDPMKETLSLALGISKARVGIKATTNEKLGTLGRKEGIAAMAVAMISLPDEEEDDL